MGYEYLEHRADIGMRVSADTLEGIFQDAAEGLFNIIYDAHTVSPIKSFSLLVQAPTLEFLVIEFLNEIVSLMDRKGIFFSQCVDIVIDAKKKIKVVQCVLRGESQNRDKHMVKTEVKAATYSGLSLTRVNNNYIFQCLFDV